MSIVNFDKDDLRLQSELVTSADDFVQFVLKLLLKENWSFFEVEQLLGIEFKPDDRDYPTREEEDDCIYSELKEWRPSKGVLSIPTEFPCLFVYAFEPNLSHGQGVLRAADFIYLVDFKNEPHLCR